MASTKTLLYYGALLHDADVAYMRARQTGAVTSSEGGDSLIASAALRNPQFAGSDGQVIAEQTSLFRESDQSPVEALPGESLAYVTWFASDVASGSVYSGQPVSAHQSDADADADLRKIFNSLYGHTDDNALEHASYAKIVEALKNGLSELHISSNEINALLNLLEDTLSSVPAQTDPKGLIDVSLYDHAKITAGLASCAYEYLCAHDVHDYRDFLFNDEDDTKAWSENMYLLYSCDMSGIQDFIYNISGDGALKQLRARSMYLELLLEHVVDELLKQLDLNRTNLLYTGGGHAYMLLPNTEASVSTIQAFQDELNAWFVSNYRNDLYVAGAWVACSAGDLANDDQDKGRYPSLYQRLSRGLSEAKATRYDASVIRMLNFRPEPKHDHTRECSECHRSDLRINADGKCPLCASLGLISPQLIKKDVFVVEEHAEDTRNNPLLLELPFDCTLRMLTYEQYRSKQLETARIYVKGTQSTQLSDAIRIWMGDYTADYAANPNEVGIAAYAQAGATLDTGKGIQRLGVLRADVDDLGATFANGLPNEKACLCRTIALSRSLSYFFKVRINEILSEKDYQLQIIYSGGDDLFVVGNWNDVLHAAADIHSSLNEYTGNCSLTISAGIGMFEETYPIANMASETGALEDAAKGYQSSRGTKNAIAMWSDERVFNWDEFTGHVMPRMNELREMFQDNEKGSSFIYRIIALLRNYDDVASAPRLAYLLARSFEDDRGNGGKACAQLYEWAQDPKERKRLVAAMEWYVCSERKGNEL